MGDCRATNFKMSLQDTPRYLKLPPLKEAKMPIDRSNDKQPQNPKTFPRGKGNPLHSLLTTCTNLESVSL